MRYNKEELLENKGEGVFLDSDAVLRGPYKNFLFCYYQGVKNVRFS